MVAASVDAQRRGAHDDVDLGLVAEAGFLAGHGQGIAGAPKFGDKALWAPRVAQGVDVLYQHALNGFQGKGGLMPPKGGNTSLSDAEVKAAVDYMVAAAK